MNRILRYACFCMLGVISMTTSVAQNWLPLTDADSARWLPDGLLLGDKFYVLSGFKTINGYDESITPSFEVYDIPTDTWTSLTPTPLSKYETDPKEAGATHNSNVLVGDKIWVIGGRTGTHPGPVTEEVWIYDTNTDTWSAGPDLPIPIAGGGCVLVGGTLHYVGGFFNACSGMSENHFTLDVDAWKASPGTVSWENWRKPNPRLRAHISVAYLAGKIYSFGGEFGHDCCQGGPVCRQDLADADVYDIETDTWSILPDLLAPRSHAEHNSFAMDGKIYQVGSEIYDTESKTTFVYDPDLNSWYRENSWEFETNIMAPAVGVYRDRVIRTHGGYPARGDARTTSKYTTITRTPKYKLGWGKDKLDFWVYQGLSASQDAMVWTESGSLTADLELVSPAPWISIPATVDLDITGKRIPISVNSSGLAPGTYTVNVRVKGTGPDVVNPATTVSFTEDILEVELTVGPSPDGVVVMSQPDPCEEVELGSTETFLVTLETPGATAVNLTGSSFSNPEFSLNGSLPGTLPANGQINLSVNFTPTATGTKTSTFTVTHNGAGGSTDLLLSCEAIPTCMVPTGWTSSALGTPALPGSACATGSTYRMTAAGNNIWAREDEGQFLSTPVTGDGYMIIKVNSVTEQDEDTKIGIMFRESLDANSANAFLAINPNNTLRLQYRPGTAEGTFKAQVQGYYPPHYLKLERVGNTYTASQSEDGVTFTVLNNSNNPATFPMSTTIHAGIALTSHNVSAISVAEVTAVSSTFSSPVFPVTLEAFEGEVIDGAVQLKWKASNEVNFSHYEVQRRAQMDSNFYSVSTVAAQGKSIYRTWDTSPKLGANIYRLAMHDIDGQVEYSDQIELELGTLKVMDVYKIPGIQMLELRWYEQDTEANIRLLDISGRQILAKESTLKAGTPHRLSIPGLSSGLYLVEVIWGSRSKRVILSME